MLLGGLCAALTGVSVAQTNITEFPIVRVAPVLPEGITYGPDGAYWFAEFAQFNGGVIGRIDTVSNVLTEIGLTNGPNYAPYAIVSTGGYLWFTEHTVNQIARLSTNLTYVEFPFTNANSGPFNMTVGPDGGLWFVEFTQNKIAAFDPQNPANTNGTLKFTHEYGPFGSSTRFGSPGTNAEINGLTTGPDNNLWFTQVSYGAIGRLTTNGVATVFYLANSNCEPGFIASGPDGALWFTEYNVGKIGRITTDGSQVTEYVIPTFPGYPMPEPYGIIAGQDGNLWFTEYNGSAIGRITTNGIITLFPTPTQPSLPTMLATNTWGRQ